MAPVYDARTAAGPLVLAGAAGFTLCIAASMLHRHLTTVRPPMPSVKSSSLSGEAARHELERAADAAQSVIPSPLTTTLPQLTPSSVAGLAYPPSTPLLPNPRDVSTAWGRVRAYEWGSTDPGARKVVFVHGISTPCISLRRLAHLLATQHGCRVCLFDLWGRGFSDAPATGVYDGKLYAAQLLAVLGASEVAWPRFTLVGYSLGGGIAADFTSWFPERVAEAVLIAPGGLVRRGDVSLRSKIIYSTGLFPEHVLREAVRRRLTADPAAVPTSRWSPKKLAGVNDKKKGDDVAANAVSAELPTAATNAVADFDMESAVAWQLENHAGFVHAYMASIRHAPIHDQHPRWRLIGQRQRLANETKPEAVRALDTRKMLLILGENDPLVKPAEIVPDAEGVLGKEQMAAQVVKGAGHELPISHAEECVRIMVEHWNSRPAS